MQTNNDCAEPFVHYLIIPNILYEKKTVLLNKTFRCQVSSFKPLMKRHKCALHTTYLELNIPTYIQGCCEFQTIAFASNIISLQIYLIELQLCKFSLTILTNFSRARNVGQTFWPCQMSKSTLMNKKKESSSCHVLELTKNMSLQCSLLTNSQLLDFTTISPRCAPF